MSAKRGLCPWNLPDNQNKTQLRLYNSLTRNKEIFVPQNGNQVLWYSCGPTVYDSSHMGHARSYISFDIMRRILQDYFKYDVFYCMNITDIDDKIIKRARQTRLFDDYKKETHQVDTVISTVTVAADSVQAKLDTETDEAKKIMLTNTMSRATDTLKKLADLSDKGDQAKLQELLENVRDSVSEHLDKLHGAEITDNSIFFDLPRKFEAEYFADMESLNILPPDVLTRVTEYVPEIVEFVKKIIDNGFAYEVNGSVYFMTSKFNQDEKHFYAKLVPEAFGDSDALAEGEGDLSNTGSEKKNPTDFALWKVSKPGEPSWDSPWGKGRPGWHIECSVMASQILGDSIDIHTGGYDLKFPHHDNELAQAEACFGHSHWIRYFLHSGHLTIQGMKMSKSLKNFTSIQKALETYTAVQIRFAFLLHSWKDTLDYSNETMEITLTYERTFKEFFLNMKSILRNLTGKGSSMFRKWGDEEVKLNQSLSECKTSVHAALCDSIDTRGALESMRTLITQTNIYTKTKQTSQQPCDYMILSNISSYITDILRIFGAIDKDCTIGFTQKSESSVNLEETVMPYLDCIADFRKSVKKNAASNKDTTALKLCDEIRDDILPFLGVRMEDIDGDNTAIKLVDKETLIKERDEKIKAKEAERKAKEEKKAKLEAEKKAKEAQKRIPPTELFTVQTDKFSQFDDKGMPTHAADGSEISKGQLKKLQKLYDSQAKKYQDYLKEES